MCTCGRYANASFDPLAAPDALRYELDRRYSEFVALHAALTSGRAPSPLVILLLTCPTMSRVTGPLGLLLRLVPIDDHAMLT